MTDFMRPSTLTLRRAAAGSSRPKNVVVPPASVERASEAGDEASRVVRSESLLQGRNHISIAHNGETYQLRATRLGKLILTK